jgi:hypothetical protein
VLRTILLTTLTVGILIAVAFAVSAFDGRERVGLWAGSVVGALMALIGASAQMYIARKHPKRVMDATVIGFLFLLTGLMASAVSVRFAPTLVEVADWQLFIVAYAAGALVPLLAGTVSSAAALKGRTVA